MKNLSIILALTAATAVCQDDPTAPCGEAWPWACKKGGLGILCPKTCAKNCTTESDVRCLKKCEEWKESGGATTVPGTKPAPTPAPITAAPITAAPITAAPITAAPITAAPAPINTTHAEGPTTTKNSSGVVTLTGTYTLEPCTIDVTNFTGLDIADHFQDYNNPFIWFINSAHPGVTLLGPDRAKKCSWTIADQPQNGEVHFTWNAKKEQCTLNGRFGYMDVEKETCTTGEPYVMDRDSRSKWSKASAAGTTVTVAGIPGTTGPVPVMIGYGHGVLDSPCGGVALVKQDQNGVDHYAAIVKVGTRAWSYEISSPANTYLASDNSGGGCYIPDVALLSEDDVDQILALL